MGEAGGSQLVSDRLGDVQLVEVRRQPEPHPAAGEVGAEQPVAGPGLEQPGRVDVLDRGGVGREVLARFAERPAADRLHLGPVHCGGLRRLVEGESCRH